MNKVNEEIHTDSQLTQEGLLINKTNDPLISEINDLLSDTDSPIQKKISSFTNKQQYIIEITIQKEIIQFDKDIKFLLIINKKNYPKEKPEILCFTKFCFPHLCDGRNLLDNILDSNIYTLEILVNKIPKFIIKHSENSTTDKLKIVGNFKLNSFYSLKLLKELPINLYLLPQENKNIILTISDISFCLYELSVENSGICKLIFFIDINQIKKIEINDTENKLILKFKNNQNDVILITQRYKIINKILNEKMKIYIKKEGEIPDIQIDIVENEISNTEKKINDEKDINYPLISNLMSLYQKGIEYYSAINNPKYKEYTIKIQKLLETNEMNEYLMKNMKENLSKDIDNNKLEDKNNDKKNKHEEIKKEEKAQDKNVKNKKEEVFKEKDDKKVNKINDFKQEKKEVIKDDKTSFVEKNQKNKKEDNKNESLRLKISTENEEIGTLDVGDDDEDD